MVNEKYRKGEIALEIKERSKERKKGDESCRTRNVGEEGKVLLKEECAEERTESHKTRSKRVGSCSNLSAQTQ